MNLLTDIRSEHYSAEMNSEFEQLSEKISLLGELTQSLRRENAGLRQNAAVLATENAELAQRMDAAHQRVAALLEKFPASGQDEQDEEAA